MKTLRTVQERQNDIMRKYMHSKAKSGETLVSKLLRTLSERKQSIIIAVITAAVCIIGVTAAMYITRDKTKASVGNYEAPPLPDYTQFLPENAIKAMIGDDGYAYLADSLVYYKNGEYIKAEEPPCRYENGVFYITTVEYGRRTAEELAGDIQAEYVIYDSRLVVFSHNKDFADVYSDIYTLESLALRLSGASEADIVNAFITLPNFISNGETNSVYYTDPNLNLGVQTEIYGLSLENFDTGYEKLDKAPMIAAGQGENADNSTLVRIFNSSQACTAQFLAYPAEVTGGVQVKAGRTSSGKALIVTAPFTSLVNASKCIKVFDTFGSLIYSFTPQKAGAPYAIEVGNFTKDGSGEQIFVTSAVSGGEEILCELYNIEDGSFIKSMTLKCEMPSQKISLSAAAADNNENNPAYQQVIITFLENKEAYYIDCERSSWKHIEIKLPDNAEGVYESAFNESLIASLSEDRFSNIRIYGSGVSDNLEGSLLNVGYKENRFYSTYAENNPDGYVDYAEFHHIRTDLSNRVLENVGSYSGKNKNIISDIMKKSSYYDWKYTLSDALKEKYHSQYNVWEPCFTHRWGVMNATLNLMSVTDEETGYTKYGSIGRDNYTSEYKELDSSFLIGTYADGIIDLAKMRIYPLRMMLQQLAVEFRGENGEPERLVDVSPVHEQEINVAGSVGDYNPQMIEGFRKYLLALYGSVQNINERFGTDFASEEEIDAPRFDPEGENINESRGKWDEYGNSDYFTQWSLYTRNIINKRVLEAYREALIAGFPPEAINAHQIPEGDAVSGFLGEADTRISPTDVVSICGTAYGGTRYGYFCNDANNFIQLAYRAGHNNITLGEYSSLASERDQAYTQLKYLFDNGVKFTHIIVPYEANTPLYTYVKNSELDAVAMLQEENNPRTASTGGTGALVAVSRGDKSYDIVQIGDADKNGLLKSVNEDGSWEGTVYLVPFRSGVTVKSIEMNECGNGYISAPIKNMQYGDQAELTFLSSYTGSGDAYVTVQVFHAGYEIEAAKTVYKLSSSMRHYRYVLSNQLALENLEIRITFNCDDMSKVSTDELQCTSQTENAAHKYFGILNSASNKGGVTFDIIG